MYFQNGGGLAMYKTSIYQKRRAVIIYFNYHTKLKHAAWSRGCLALERKLGNHAFF